MLPGMLGAPAGARLMALLVLVLLGVQANLHPRTLQRSHGQRWKSINETMVEQIHKATARFMAETNEPLLMPVRIEVWLLGFDGDGAFGHEVDIGALEQQLTAKPVCPTLWDTGRKSTVCYEPEYVVYPDDVHGTDQTQPALMKLEQGLARLMRPVAPDDAGTGGAAAAGAGAGAGGAAGLPAYVIEATAVEPLVTELLEALVGSSAQERLLEEQTNLLLVINPDKARMSPLPDRPDPAFPRTPLLKLWEHGGVNSSSIYTQPGAQYTYRYSYGGKGASAAWISQHDYLLLDVSAGPNDYGPAPSPSDPPQVPNALPSLVGMYSAMMAEVEGQPQGTLHEAAREELVEGHHALFAGQLSEALASAARHLFMPDLALSLMQRPQRLMVPVIVLRDHDDLDPLQQATPQGAAAAGGTVQGSGAIQLDVINQALHQLVDPDTMVSVLPAGTRYLHQHKQLLAALHKARTGRSRAVVMAHSGSSSSDAYGLHVTGTSHIDGQLLLQELMQASDGLMQDWLHATGSLFGMKAAPAGPGRVPLAQAAQGTRLLPVFVLSLRNAPPHLTFEGRSLVASNRHAVVVLQLLGDPVPGTIPAAGGDAAGSGAPAMAYAPLFSGHLQGGRQVMVDPAAATGHIVAGLASSLAGLVPPYQQWDPLGEAWVQDWRWAVGATPWGPYSSYSGLSAGLGLVAQRNMVISQVAAAQADMAGKLDEIDAFVSTHLGGPFQLEPPSGKARGPSHRHHWLDALAATAGGYNITFDRAMVARLHSRTAEAAALLQRLAALMFDGSDFASLHGAVRSLFAVVDAFVGEASADLAAAAEVISCCRLVSSAAVTTWWGGVKEGVSVVAMCVVGVAALGVVMLVIAVRSSRRQRLTLPQAASELLPSWSPSPSMRFSDSRPGSLRVPGTYGGTLPGGFGSPPGSGRLQGFGSPTA